MYKSFEDIPVWQKTMDLETLIQSIWSETNRMIASLRRKAWSLVEEA